MAFDTANFIRSGPNGRFLEGGTTKAEVDAIVAKVMSSERAVLHFHGGLVDEHAGMTIAWNMAVAYGEAGAYPVTFVWRSGILEVVPANLREIAGESLFKTLLKWVMKYALGKIGQDTQGVRGGAFVLPRDTEVARELNRRNAGQEPYDQVAVPESVAEPTTAELAALERDLSMQPAVQEVAAALAAPEEPESAAVMERGALVRVATADTLLDPEVVAELRAEAARRAGERGLVSTAFLARKGAQVLLAVLRRFRAHTGHGLYPTVVEEILRAFYLANVGGTVWQMIKQETLDTFQPGAPDRVGRYFVDQLTERLAAEPNRPRIALVGHSTGAVFINNLLNDLAAKRVDPANPLPADFSCAATAFLAPACTFESFAPVLRQHRSLLGRFRLFTMSDAAERSDHLVGFVYPRSLLYFVSGLVERDTHGCSVVMPLVGLERYYRDDAFDAVPQIAVVRDFVLGGDDRAVWSPIDGGPGRSSGARSHTSFDEDPQVLASLQHLVAKE
jgi:hypothetical protein